MSRKRVRGLKRVWLYLDAGERCALCGERVTVEEYTVDHITPLSKGGLNTRSNMQVAHRRCNQAKGDRV